MKFFIIFLFFLIGEEIAGGGETEGANEIALQSGNSLFSPNCCFINIAHRGASGYAPEHPLVYYQIGKDTAVDKIEIGFQMIGWNFNYHA
ncbi:hypothetical protein ACDX78_07160 [Virgibacillus oceani]